MKVLLAFDKYKGSLNAEEVSSVVTEGFKRHFPNAHYKSLPLADGGEGFTRSLVNATGGTIKTALVEDALGRIVEAQWGLIPYPYNGNPNELAGVIEMSAASGLWRIAEEERDVMHASSYGAGQLIKAAAETPNVVHLYVGLGGSATNDMGTGMAQALGIQLHGISGRACPQTLPKLTGIDLTTRYPLPPITVACDVDNPLCGPNGAAAIFGPQKGATPELVETLDTLLDSIAECTEISEMKTSPGAGAAGGMGFGMLAFTDAKLVSGFNLVAEAFSLDEAIRTADIVITGEGGLDAQTLSGKVPIGVAQIAKKHQTPCYAIAGKVDSNIDWSPHFAKTTALIDTGIPVRDLINQTERHLTNLAAELAQEIKTTGHFNQANV